MKYSGIIFDLYNTLIHTTYKSHCYRRFFQKRKTLSRETIYTAMTKQHDNFAELAVHLSMKIEDFSEYETALKKELRSAQLYPEVKQVLHELKSYKIAVISNLATPYCQPFFDLGLNNFVDDYIFSCEMGITKPNPQIYKIIQQKWSLPPREILMVGDSLTCDVHGPYKVGFDAILLNRSQQINTEVITVKSLCELKNHL
ncbi:HAD family hydrolase [Candidatus Uabimicrobium sp. HlEnr_7]|uniref:HAD family hydrolase n=1 Tax=Candidatus Uabimicrobium helgolandensis TaxID=3095367 RepID=UPI00355641FC